MQALAPWISRLRNSLGHPAESLAAQCSSKPVHTAVMACTQTASNDSNFNLGLPLHAQPGNRALPSSSRISLRIVRESDSAIRHDCAGRMVISGRMADVCAELDRMALRADAVES